MASLAVLYGSVRTNRQGIVAANFIVQQLEKRGHSVSLLDPQELDLPLLQQMYKEQDTPSTTLKRVHSILSLADGFVIVSGEYNHSVPPALKNLLDHFQKEYYFKPAGIVTYSAGPFGGVRAAGHLRTILGELGMVTPSTMLPISNIGEFDKETYDRRSKQFLDEFEWYVAALILARKQGTPF